MRVGVLVVVAVVGACGDGDEPRACGPVPDHRPIAACPTAEELAKNCTVYCGGSDCKCGAMDGINCNGGPCFEVTCTITACAL